MLNRRQFGALAAGSVGTALTRKLWASEVQGNASGQYFYFAIVADPHIIDGFYHGPEGNPEDTESIFHTTERLTSARDFINSLQPAIEKLFLVGDYVHNYPSTDYDFYFQNRTRLDNAKEITDRFKMPVHIGMGNHDYDVHRVPREFSHRLFAAKFQLKPYYTVEYKGWKFIHLNNQLGDTWNTASQGFDPDTGSFGETQLNWLEAELRERKPTFVFTHYPLWDCMPSEISGYGLHPLLRKYQDTIQLVVAGHWHKWIDFAHTFGPQHYVMAATRYDPNAYMLMEVDTHNQSWRFLNSSLVQWSTHFSSPYARKSPA
jgi:hypothetical protein